ncbi:MAG: MarR family winged helix-turn-helix transcriptional regulator [Cryomorphaceae bacterium]|nr:MarR family transcriptional regulator [Flavobacteriales bacterium]
MKINTDDLFVKNLHLISKDYFGALSHMMVETDLDRNYYTLLLICESGDGLTQKKLSEFLEVDKVTMSRKIDHLHGLGYVERRSNPADRRTVLIAPSEKASHILESLKRAFSRAEREAFRGIEPCEREAFLATAQKVRSNIGGMPKSPVKLEYKQKSSKP